MKLSNGAKSNEVWDLIFSWFSSTGQVVNYIKPHKSIIHLRTSGNLGLQKVIMAGGQQRICPWPLPLSPGSCSQSHWLALACGGFIDNYPHRFICLNIWWNCFGENKEAWSFLEKCVCGSRLWGSKDSTPECFLLPLNESGRALSVTAPMLLLSATMIVMDTYPLGTVSLK